MVITSVSISLLVKHEHGIFNLKELKKYGADSNDSRYKYFTIHGINNSLSNNIITCDFFKDSLLIIDESHNLRKEDRNSKLAHNIITCAKECKKVLLLTGDTTSKVINNKDRSLKMVFGDGGSATLIEVGTDVLSFIIYSDGSQYNDLIILDTAGRMHVETALMDEIKDIQNESKNIS